MTAIKTWKVPALLIVGLSFSQVYASQDTIGPIGINSAGLTTANGLPLDGGAIASLNPVAIGQVESFRPGDNSFDTDATLKNATVDPAGVFFLKRGPPITYNATANTASEIGPPPYPFPANAGHHSIGVAGVMISTAMDNPNTLVTPTGVATGAHLYSIGQQSTGVDDDVYLALASQQIALLPTVPGVDVRAINMSVGVTSTSGASDGNSRMTLFVDWSARTHEVLYVAAGTESLTGGPTGAPAPTDNFNGITVAYSAKIGGAGMYRQVGTFNTFNEDAEGVRTSVDILAPGDAVDTVGRGTARLISTGTSFAAPHVTGTVALMQQYANERIVNAGWNAVNPRRHETMKAVLMNSADKIKDDGMTIVGGNAVPVGGFLGMERTVVKQDGMSTWLDSDAYAGFQPHLIPLDEQLGAGHLNAKRALQQFRNGEFDSDGADVPIIGWDLGHTAGEDDNNKYLFAQKLVGGSFISITLAWDRHVVFDNDADMDGEFDIGDTFVESTANPPNDDQINDLDLYLLPKGAPDFFNPIASSESAEGTLEHIFFQIPTTGEYEFWVNQFDGDIPGGQDYAVAWWAVTLPGDYDGNGTVEISDYEQWKTDYGSTTMLAADGNGDGTVNAADYPVWRNNLGATLGSGAIVNANVPEPSAANLLLTLGLALVAMRAAGRRPLDA